MSDPSRLDLLMGEMGRAPVASRQADGSYPDHLSDVDDLFDLCGSPRRYDDPDSPSKYDNTSSESILDIAARSASIINTASTSVMILSTPVPENCKLGRAISYFQSSSIITGRGKGPSNPNHGRPNPKPKSQQQAFAYLKQQKRPPGSKGCNQNLPTTFRSKVKGSGYGAAPESLKYLSTAKKKLIPTKPNFNVPQCEVGGKWGTSEGVSKGVLEGLSSNSHLGVVSRQTRPTGNSKPPPSNSCGGGNIQQSGRNSSKSEPDYLSNLILASQFENDAAVLDITFANANQPILCGALADGTITVHRMKGGSNGDDNTRPDYTISLPSGGFSNGGRRISVNEIPGFRCFVGSESCTHGPKHDTSLILVTTESGTSHCFGLDKESAGREMFRIDQSSFALPRHAMMTNGNVTSNVEKPAYRVQNAQFYAMDSCIVSLVNSISIGLFSFSINDYEDSVKAKSFDATNKGGIGKVRCMGTVREKQNLPWLETEKYTNLGCTNSVMSSIVLVGTNTGKVKVWDLACEKIVTEYQHYRHDFMTLNRDSSGVPSGVSSGLDNDYYKFTCLRTVSPFHSMLGSGGCVGPAGGSPLDLFFTCSSSTGCIDLYDLRIANQLPILRFTRSHKHTRGTQLKASVSGCMRYLGMPSEDGGIAMYDVRKSEHPILGDATLNLRLNLRNSLRSRTASTLMKHCHSDVCSSVIFHPTLGTMFSCGYDRRIISYKNKDILFPPRSGKDPSGEAKRWRKGRPMPVMERDIPVDERIEDVDCEILNRLVENQLPEADYNEEAVYDDGAVYNEEAFYDEDAYRNGEDVYSEHFLQDHVYEDDYA